MGLKRHLMELPKLVLIGYGVIEELREVIERLGASGTALVVSGPNVKAKLEGRIEGALEGYGHEWFVVDRASMDRVELGLGLAKGIGAGLVIGFGGGKSIDTAKLIAYKLKLPFVSIPTSASHDGMASPFASVKDGGRPYSMVTKPPACVISDIEIIASAPPRFIRSGCGDLLAKLTAVRDWEIARDDVGEYFGNYAANLARLSATIVMNEAKRIGSLEEEGVRDLVEALISAGIASGIAGSSRPCSGSEHLFSHALDVIAPGKGLHGEKCGIGAVMMAKLQGGDWEAIRKALEEVGAPTRASDLGLGEDEVVKALLLAPRIRDRYTILNRVKLGAEEAYRLARETGVI